MQAYGQMNTGGQIYGLNPNVSPSNQALRPTTAPFGETAGPSYDNHGLGRQPAPFVATDYSQRPKTSAEDFFAGISSSQQQASQQQSHPSEHPVPLQSQSQQPIRQTPVAPDQSRFGAEQHLNDARGTPADQRVGHRPGLSMEAPNPGLMNDRRSLPQPPVNNIIVHGVEQPAQRNNVSPKIPVQSAPGTAPFLSAQHVHGSPPITNPVASIMPDEVSLDVGAEGIPKSGMTPKRQQQNAGGLLPSYSPENKPYDSLKSPPMQGMGPGMYVPPMPGGLDPGPGMMPPRKPPPDLQGMQALGQPQMAPPHATNPTGQFVQAGLRQNAILPRGGPIVSFGFGGSLLCMSSANQAYGGGQPGKLRVYDLGSVLFERSNDYDAKVLHECIEMRGDAKSEAKHRQRLLEMCDRLSTFSHPNKTNAEGFKALWRILKALYQSENADRASLAQAINGNVIAVQQQLTKQTALKSPLRANSNKPESLAESARKMQEVLANGRTQEAVKLAKEAGLWDLALVLSSTMDRQVSSRGLRVRVELSPLLLS